MVNVKNKLCGDSNCNSIALYNIKGEKTAIYCKAHKKETMVNVVNKLCQEENCNVCPSFNIKSEKSAIYCGTHKKENMIRVTHKLCQEPNCKSVPSFNYEGLKIGIYCGSHKKENMINVFQKRCKMDNCQVSVRNNINDKYKGYCFFCFLHIFPDEPMVKNFKTKEKYVSDSVKERFSDYTWIIDKKIEGGCSKKRPDMFLDFGSHVIIIEIDESQHNGYSCENKRTMIISQDIEHRPLVIIRFNPDGYKIKEEKNITSCWATNQYGIHTIKRSKKKEWNDRLEILYKEIEYWTRTVPDKIIKNIYLFYDKS